MATLYEYYKGKGQNLPSVQERAKEYERLGLGPASQYFGTSSQNVAFLSKLMATPSAAPAAPGVTPAVPVDPLAIAAKTAGQTGGSLNDFSSVVGQSEEEQKHAKDTLATQFGYPSFDDFTKEVFAKPSKTTQQFYEEAYKTAGLDSLLSDISSRRQQVTEAEAKLRDNPWLSEASLRGRTGRLSEKTEAVIQNLLQDYDLRAGKVKDLVSAYSDDLGTDERIREARFNYLMKAAEEKSATAAQSKLAGYLPSYLEGKKAAQVPTAPKTITIGDTAYAFDPVTKDWTAIARNPKPVKAPAPSPKQSPTSTEEKLKTAFRKDLANRVALDRSGTREQRIRELQALYPQIEPADIARALYETYPDDYNKK